MAMLPTCKSSDIELTRQNQLQVMSEPEEDELIKAIKDKEINKIRALLSDGHHNIHQLYKESFTEVYSLLNYAAVAGSIDTVLLLLELGIQIDVDYPEIVSPLETAIAYAYTRVSQLLVKRGAKVSPELFFETVKMGFEDVASVMFEENGLRLLRVTEGVKRSSFTCRKKENTPFRDLIRFMPKLAMEVLNKCAVKGSNPFNSENFSASYVYELIEDFQDVISQSTGTPGKVIDIEAKKYIFKDAMTKTGNGWGPKKFSKHNHPLSIMVRHKREDLLKHPVVSSLIHYKWRFGVISYVLNLIFYLFFLTFLTSYALLLPNPQTITCLPGLNTTMCEGIPESSQNTYLKLAAVVVLAISSVRILLEFAQIYFHVAYYFTELSNWIELPLFICSMIFTALPNWSCPCVYDWRWQIGAVALFLAWFDLILFTSKMPYIGKYVLMFVQICKTFLKLSLLTFLLVVTFGLSFFMIFSDPRVSRSSFGSGFRSLIRTLVMTTGELGYDGIFRLDSSDINNNEPELSFVYTAYVLWVPFVILMPVLFANLLTGLAVGDTGKVEKEAEFQLLAQQIDQFLTIEEWVHKWLIRKLFNLIWPSLCCKKCFNCTKSGIVVKPNERRKGFDKSSHYTARKLLGWNHEFDTLEAVKKALDNQMDEMAQMRANIEQIMMDMRELKSGGANIATSEPPPVTNVPISPSRNSSTSTSV